MPVHKSAAVALVAFTLGTLPAAAQEAQSVEVTPYVALGSDLASPAGAAITFPITSNLGVEADVAYRRAEGHLHALSFSSSLLYSLPRIGRSTPYLATGLGLSQYGSPVFSSSGRPIGTQSRLAMTLNAGGGLKTKMNEKMDWRTDARWGKFIGRDGPSEWLRVAQGISFDVGRR